MNFSVVYSFIHFRKCRQADTKNTFISIAGSSDTITLEKKCVINLKLLVWFGKSILAFS